MCNNNEKKEYLEIYKVIRSRIEFEYSQIGNRLNWLLTSQAFLFIALVSGIKNNDIKDLSSVFGAIKFISGNSLLYPILPFLGLIVSFFVIISTWAAILRIANFKKNENCISKILKDCSYNYVKKDCSYDYAVTQRNQLIHYLGLSPTIFIPVSFLLIWFFIINPNLDFGYYDFDLFNNQVANSMAMSIIFLFIFNISLGMFIAIIFIDEKINEKKWKKYLFYFFIVFIFNLLVILNFTKSATCTLYISLFSSSFLSALLFLLIAWLSGIFRDAGSYCVLASVRFS